MSLKKNIKNFGVLCCPLSPTPRPPYGKSIHQPGPAFIPYPRSFIMTPTPLNPYPSLPYIYLSTYLNHISILTSYLYHLIYISTSLIFDHFNPHCIDHTIHPHITLQTKYDTIWIIYVTTKQQQ